MASPTLADDNRFARFNDEDHSAPMWIASILAIVFAYLIMAIRLLFVKWNMYGFDDVVLTMAHLLGLGMWASLFSSLDNGLGQALKLLDATQISHMNQAYFASRILLFLALSLSKCSVLIFIQGIFSHMDHVRLVVNVTIGVVVLWGVAGALAVSIGSSPDTIVGDHEASHRVNDVIRLRVITVIDVITEVVIFLLPLIPLLKLQMPWRRKFLVMIAFSFRIPNIVSSIMHLSRYTEFVDDGRGISISGPVVWQNILLSYSLMSATIPALKGFMASFITGGMGYTNDMSGGGGSSGNSNSYRMLTLNSEGRVKDKMTLLPEGNPKSTALVTSIPRTPEDSARSGTTRRTTQTQCPAENVQETESIASHGSQKTIMRKDWGITRA
ncbi:hypothetical protein K505DRAFT_5699 [Melanomma pulvis-pyrius CBS 109.77]|uniref:Rhodopsin domain-containing protein n=1 Tax=Melanomma pulvis-pyrius CBS 109.77 TaxID=1314802 RepID=A0A6A6XHJ4_9PLEO|nr:hypothetical protein K505DRAFT_5699 [Melanomma pulvis-pyrius CBS 109.77]